MIKRILMIAKGYLPDDGGIERYSTDFARAYATTAKRIYVLTQATGPTGVRRDGRVIVLNVGKAAQPVVFARILWRLVRLLPRIRPDLVHATTWRMALPFLFVRQKAPFAVTVHGREVLIVPVVLRPFMRAVLNQADLVSVVSRSIEKLVRPLVPRSRARWIVTWNGLSFLDDARAAPSRESPGSESVRIYTFCRLVERKNVQGALRALALLKSRGVGGFRYVIAGDGPMRPELERLTDALKLRDVVTFLGRIPEEQITELYQAADVFLHPQIAAEGGRDIEGFGLTIADAMSFGAVVVVGESGGPGDFVKNGETGLVVDGTSDEAIAAAVQALLSEPHARLKFAAVGRAWALAKLSWTRAAASLVDEAAKRADVGMFRPR